MSHWSPFQLLNKCMNLREWSTSFVASSRIFISGLTVEKSTLILPRTFHRYDKLPKKSLFQNINSLQTTPASNFIRHKNEWRFIDNSALWRLILIAEILASSEHVQSSRNWTLNRYCQVHIAPFVRLILLIRITTIIYTHLNSKKKKQFRTNLFIHMFIHGSWFRKFPQKSSRHSMCSRASETKSVIQQTFSRGTYSPWSQSIIK